MDFKQLHTFAVVAKEKSFTRAAEILNYAQSSVSGQIQALEQELGAPLFDRLGRGVMLTDTGRNILPLVQSLFRIEEEIRAIAFGNKEPSGTLIVGAPESLIAYRLSRMLSEFHKRYPKVHLHFQTGGCAEHRESLQRGEMDVAFLLEAPIVTDGLIMEHLVDERILLVAEPRSPLSSMECIAPSDLAEQVFLMVESTKGGWSYREIFEHQLIQARVYPSKYMEFASVEAVKQCAISGVGIAILPEVVVRKELEERKLVALKWPAIVLPTQLAWNKDRWIPSAMQAFIRSVREFVGKQEA
ncbi:MAG: LysR family transcriptional regulator [Alicyclobacillus sp.]|nr:LysR family transcriptional regulator [Alicyclobacillus sp.]